MNIKDYEDTQIPCNHNWVWVKDLPNGMILQRCTKCGKTRIVDADTET